MDMITASTMVTATSISESRMLTDVSFATLMCRSSSPAYSVAMTLFTALETSIAVLLCCLVMERDIVSSPL